MLWVAAALADEAESRRALWDTLLAEAERGDVPSAVGRYQELARTLGAESPTQAEALYWLGHGLYELGRVPEARAALLDGIRSGRCGRCRELLEEIELEQHSLTTVPTVFTFAGEHGLFHPWAVQDRGAIRVADGVAGPALQWTTLARSGEADRLEAGVRAPSARQVRFTVRSTSLDAWIQVQATDVVGRVFAAEPIEVARGTVRRIVVAFEGMDPTDEGKLDPSDVARIAIVDVTGVRASGPNVLWLDDFELR